MLPESLRNVAGKKIALGVCGGIAAYKVVEVARRLTGAGADVRVVMSPSASNFVGAITFSTLTGNPVRSELFPQTVAAEIVHTDLGRTSDLILIAPATAKVISKFAGGLSDDLMSAMLLSAACPILMAPAMHTEMWEDEATRNNVAILTGRGVRFVGPEAGALAGPDIGIGRLADVSEILSAADEELARRKQLTGMHVVVTAGATREPIDPVRYLGNRSSGKMGYELAREAWGRGARVSLVSGPSSLTPPAACDVIQAPTAAEMESAVGTLIEEADMLIMAAAVSDWRPSTVASNKLSKSDGPPQILLEPTEDILAAVGARRSAGKLPKLKVLAGFCAETTDVQARATVKLKEKELDLIVANEVGVPGSGFESETNRATIIDRRGGVEELPLLTKRNLARHVMDAAASFVS